MPLAVHVDALEGSGSMSNHRGGNIDFVRLHRGESMTADNFEWSVIQTTAEYSTPRHRHNFDQLHYILDGRHQWAPEQWMPAGSIGYFVEGCFYGPQHGGPSRQLGLQFGGASGNGFMGYDDLARGNRELQARGQFAGGTYTWVDEDGKEHRSDGYEAIWQHVAGRPVAYSEPRYDKPIIIYPEAMRWKDARGERGVERKHAGTFGERSVSVGFWRLDAGSTHSVEALDAVVLQYVLDGSVTVENTEHRSGAALRWGPDEGGTITAAQRATVYEVRLPVVA
jgi:hypothetical protein